jgi:hypothetical protein
MATNTRSVIKWIRDLAKSHYAKGSKCEICGVGHELEFHHYNTVSLTVNNYVKLHGIAVDTKEDILAMREKFLKDNWREMVEEAVTLCANHHKLLHKLYGKEPPLNTADKQKIWVERQYEKVSTGSVGTAIVSLPSSLTQFCTDSQPLSNFITR